MQLTAYLSFAGNAAEAFDFYAAALGGTIVARMTYGESPMAAEMDPASHGLVMHCQLVAGTAELMGADAPPPHDASHGGTCVNVMVDTPEEAERVFAALSDGGAVQMPMEETFWAHRFGMLVDRFGKPWMVNCLRQPAGKDCGPSSDQG